MKVVNTFHQPSSVVSSSKCNLSPNCELGHLVVARTNRIEVSSIHAEGLRHECSLDIWGRVISVRAVAGYVSRGCLCCRMLSTHEAQDVELCNLLVLADHPDPRLLLLEYDDEGEQPSLKCVWEDELRDRNGRHAELFTDIVVSPSRDVAITSCYVGKLKVVHFQAGKVDSHFEVMYVLSSVLNEECTYVLLDYRSSPSLGSPFYTRIRQMNSR